MSLPRTARRYSLLIALSLLLAACGTAAPPAPPSPVPAAGENTGPITPPAHPELILATTTSTQDSGLLDVVLPDFQQRTGYHVKPVAVGSGQALKIGEQGNADVLLVHSPDAESTFMASWADV